MQWRGESLACMPTLAAARDGMAPRGYSCGMAVIFDILYAIGFLFAVPLLVFKSWRTGKYRSGWGARFGRYGKRDGDGVSDGARRNRSG